MNPAEIRKSYTQFNLNMLPNCTTGSLGCHNQSPNHLNKASWLSIVLFFHALFMWNYLLCLYYFKHGLVDIIVMSFGGVKWCAAFSICILINGWYLSKFTINKIKCYYPIIPERKWNLDDGTSFFDLVKFSHVVVCVFIFYFYFIYTSTDLLSPPQGLYNGRQHFLRDREHFPIRAWTIRHDCGFRLPLSHAYQGI